MKAKPGKPETYEQLKIRFEESLRTIGPGPVYLDSIIRARQLEAQVSKLEKVLEEAFIRISELENSNGA